MPLTERPGAGGGVLILLLTTFLWGTTFVVSQQTLRAFPVGQLLFGRFAVAAAVFLPFLRPGRRLWLAAAELGVLLWAGYATQTVGLPYTSVARSAFITSLPVVFVPVAAGLLGRVVGPVVWVAAGLALAGVGLLCNDGGRPNVGDLWTVACAVTWAAYIVRLETFARAFPAPHLTAAQLVVVAGLCGGWVAASPAAVVRPGHGYPGVAVVYLGLAATALTTWLQAVGQRVVPAARTAVLYTLEPVFATLFAWAVLHKRPGPAGGVGAVLILAAAVLAQLPARRPGDRAAAAALRSRPESAVESTRP